MGIQDLTRERSAASTLIIISVSFFLTACAANPMFESVSSSFSGSDFQDQEDDVTGYIDGDILVDDLSGVDFPRDDLGCDDTFEYARADLNKDRKVDDQDLGLLMDQWGSDDKLADLNSDGDVNGSDLSELLASWTSEEELLALEQSSDSILPPCEI